MEKVAVFSNKLIDNNHHFILSFTIWINEEKFQEIKM